MNQNAPLFAIEPDNDCRLEVSLLGLLAGLETELSRLLRRPELAEGLAIRERMADRVAEFADRGGVAGPCAAGLREIRRRHAIFRERLLELRPRSGPIASLFLFSRGPKLDMKRQRTLLSEATRAWLETLQGYFALFEGGFFDAGIARRWANAADTFLERLRGRIDHENEQRDKERIGRSLSRVEP